MSERVPPIACCPSCKAPLICTLAFSKAEFLCLEDGRLLDWLQPASGPGDDEALNARLAELQAEWDEHAADALLSGGVMLTSCEVCSETREPHLRHASADEVTAHNEAVRWLAERTKRPDFLNLAVPIDAPAAPEKTA